MIQGDIDVITIWSDAFKAISMLSFGQIQNGRVGIGWIESGVMAAIAIFVDDDDLAFVCRLSTRLPQELRLAIDPKNCDD